MRAPSTARFRPRAAAAALAACLFGFILGGRTLLDQVGSPAQSPPVSVHRELPPFRPPTGRAQHVVVISIDGLRPDAITQARASVLLGLMEEGAHAIHAETIRPSITLPSHTAMLSGLDFRRHGVVWNNYRPGHIAHPTVFSVASRAGLSTAMLFAKDKFHFLADPDRVHWIYGPGIPKVIPKLEDVTRPDFKENTGTDPAPERAPVRTLAPAPKAAAPALQAAALPQAEPRPPPPSAPRPSVNAAGIARAFREEWPRARYQLTFVHFGEPDAAGHGRGWMSRTYLDAVLKVDQAIGSILDTLRSTGELSTTAILVTADHGGLGKQHYFRAFPDTSENVEIPWICVGPGVRPGMIISRPIRTMDTAPTVLAFLGLAPPEGIDGRVVGEVLEGLER